MVKRYSSLKLKDGGFEAEYQATFGPVKMSASWPLFIVREAWERGCNFEDLADGFGEGSGTMGGDWSGIRDSSPGAKERMVERAVNHLFGSPS